jgi:hypothetical protein
MPRTGRANYGNSTTQPISSPYILHEPDLILPGQDFTVQITTISKSILDVYSERMKKGQYGNDYFVLMSHFGIGSNQGRMPSDTINLVEPIDKITGNILSFWGENIRWIQDYRDTGSDGNAGRIYIGTSAFCQGIGGSTLDSIRKTFFEVTKNVGRFSPALAPYAFLANHAIDGIARITNKASRNPNEIVSSQLTLYPQSMGSLPAGNAYLQRGSYVLFFEDTEIEHLYLTTSGEVVGSQDFSGPIPPYVVVNIVDGLIDAPDKTILDKAVALDILEKYDSRFGIHASQEGMNSGANNDLNEGLVKIGKAYQQYAKLRRFSELNEKASRLPSEEARLKLLKQELEVQLPHFFPGDSVQDP